MLICLFLFFGVSNCNVVETGQFSSKGIIYDFKGDLNILTVSRLITESAAIR